jgi:hypothetical protein
LSELLALARPSIGPWWAPLGQYSYCGNSPLGCADPSGELSQWYGAWIGLGCLAGMHINMWTQIIQWLLATPGVAPPWSLSTFCNIARGCLQGACGFGLVPLVQHAVLRAAAVLLCLLLGYLYCILCLCFLGLLPAAPAIGRILATLPPRPTPAQWAAAIRRILRAIAAAAPPPAVGPGALGSGWLTC